MNFVSLFPHPLEIWKHQCSSKVFPQSMEIIGKLSNSLAFPHFLATQPPDLYSHLSISPPIHHPCSTNIIHPT